MINIRPVRTFFSATDFIGTLLLPFILVLTLSLISGLVLAGNSGAESRVVALNKSLVALNMAYQHAAPNARANALEELRSIAAMRHTLLSDIIKDNPRAVLQVAVSTRDRNSMPEEVRSLIEQQLDLSGELKVMYEDYEDGSARLHQLLKTSDKRISLHFSAEPHGLLSGTTVSASGVLLDDAMALESGDSILTLAAGGTSSGESAGEQNSIGEQTIAVLLVNFQNNNEEPISVTSAHDLVFNTTNSFMLENSSNLNWLSGQTFGWYNLPIDETCTDTEISNAAQAAATANGVNLSMFSRIIYMFPNNPDCGWSGLGTVGGSPSEAWINGQFNLRVVGHELGHNFTLHHAHSLECGNTTQGDSCTSQEYGDRFDIMGLYNAAHFNAFHKERLGWLNSADLEIFEVESSGQYTLDVFENNYGTRALKIPKGLDSSGMQIWYYLEYRQAIGIDAFLQNYSNVTNGIIVHTGTDQDMRSSYIYDMTPSSSQFLDWDDPALTTGSTYQDTQAGITITVAGMDGVTAQVDITLSGGGGSGGGNVPNQPPVAVADSSNTSVNTSINIPVLSNDYDPDNQAINILSATQPANGTITIKANGSIDYKPRRKYTGLDSFSYVITDGTDTGMTTVSINVQGSSSGGGGGKGGGGKGKGGTKK